MIIPFYLRRMRTAASAEAVLLPAGADVARLLDRWCRAGATALPEVFRTAAGLLVKLPASAASADVSAAVTVGGIRLRSLWPDLYLPADAELLPALSDDEADDLVRGRGLLFLPPDQIAEFDPAAPLGADELLSPPPLVRSAWAPPPEVELPAPALREIVAEIPPEAPEEIVQPGGAGIGTEEPKPKDPGAAARAAGRVQYGLGRGLMWLGKVPGLGALAKAGAGLVAGAISKVPALAGSFLTTQEMALRELLRQFREGNIEQALRRALPVGEEGGRGGAVHTGTELPRHNLAWSLAGALGGGGPASIWYGGFDVQRELSAEYRRAAEQALLKGDFRRAAFVFGRLLADWRRAAECLTKGGLHRDAAVIQLKKLNDKAAAARSYEAAGEFDRALALYQELADHVAAGDLLRRIGEDEAAEAEFVAAAGKLAARGLHLEAAELMISNAKRTDLAAGHLRAGWAKRPAGNAVACAVRLLPLLADPADPEAIEALLGEADDLFSAPGHVPDAAGFYNCVAETAGRPSLATVRDELRDRALLGLAAKMRQSARSGAPAHDLVSRLVGRSPTWSAALCADARLAVADAGRRKPSPRPPATDLVRLGDGIVTAVVQATVSRELFVGFQTGQVVRVGVGGGSGEVTQVCPASGAPVYSLACAGDGGLAAVMRHDGDRHHLTVFGRTPPGAYRQIVENSGAGPCPLLIPEIHELAGNFHLAYWDGAELVFSEARVLCELARRPMSAEPVGAFLDGRLLTAADDRLTLFDRLRRVSATAEVRWEAGRPESTGVRSVLVSWLRPADGKLEAAGVSSDGRVFWSALTVGEKKIEVTGAALHRADEPCRAAALLGPGRVAAVSAGHLNVLSAEGCGLRRVSRIPLKAPPPAACFHSPESGEVLVVTVDGHLAKVATG